MRFLISCPTEIVTSTVFREIPALAGRGYNPWRQPGDLSTNELTGTAYSL